MPRPRSGGRILRRATSQWALLAVVLATLVACATLVGVGTLLLTSGQQRALSAAVVAADGVAGSGSADLVSATITIERPEEGAPEDTSELLSGITTTMREAVQPYDSTVSLWVASPMLYLPGDGTSVAYILDADSATDHSRLTAGRWPALASPNAPAEVALPVNTAAALGLEPGDELRLTATPVHADGPVPVGVDVIVVGLMEPDRSAEWNRDVLAGAGIDSGWNRGKAYGPFLVAPGALIDADGPASRASVVMDPDLQGNPDPLPGVVRTVGGLQTTLSGQLGTRASSVVIHSGLAQMLSDDQAEQNLTAGTVLSEVILLVVLGAATLGLVGGLLVQRRSGEAELLTERGASRWQVAGAAAAESVVLAFLATALAIPLALLAYHGLLSAPPLRDAWSAAKIGANPGVTGTLALAVAAGALAPAAMVIAVAMKDRSTRTHRRVIGTLARSGADLLLVGLAALGYLQLRSHRPSTGSIDPILVVAPVLCIVAGAALALRVLPMVSKVAELGARKGKGLILPLSGWQVARGRATSGAFLAVLATASATFGVTFLRTWETSQGDQASIAVGSDLAVGAQGDASTGTTLAEATGGTVVPVTSRTVSVGAKLGGVTLIALDTRQADEVVRGRTPTGGTWSSVMQGLAPADAIDALTVSGTGETTVHLRVEGALSDESLASHIFIPAHMVATLTAVLEDEWGNRIAVEGWPVALDGEPHDVSIPTEGQESLPAGKWSVIAIDVRLGLTVDGGLKPEYNDAIAAELSIDVVGAEPTGGAWTANTIDPEAPLKVISTETTGSTINAVIGVGVYGLVWGDAHVMLLGYQPTDEVPVLVSSDFAKEFGLAAGDKVSIRMGSSPIDATMVGTVAFAPGATRGAVVLADIDTVSRARLATGDLTSLTDEWWVANPGPGSVTAIEEANLGPVETRDAFAMRLRGGPLRVGVRAALGLLVASAVLLAIAGAAAQATAAARARAISAARLRGLGVPKRTVLATELVQHVAMTSVAVLSGALLGALLSWLVGPLLVAGEGGEPAVPPAVFSCNAGTLTAVLLVLFVGAIAAGIPAVRSLVAKATAISLRMGDTS